MRKHMGLLIMIGIVFCQLFPIVGESSDWKLLQGEYFSDYIIKNPRTDGYASIKIVSDSEVDMVWQYQTVMGMSKIREAGTYTVDKDILRVKCNNQIMYFKIQADGQLTVQEGRFNGWIFRKLVQ